MPLVMQPPSSLYLEILPVTNQHQLPLWPRGLSRAQFDTLSEFHADGEPINASRLEMDVNQYMTIVREAAFRSGLVHLTLAEAIAASIQLVLPRLHVAPMPAQSWLKAAVQYFVNTTDSDHDLNSPTGFEDDAEVWNACLKLAQFDEFMVNPQDYDNA